jgi:hypothetical protein
VGPVGRATISASLFVGVREGSTCGVHGDDVPAVAVAVRDAGDQPPHPRLLRHFRPSPPLRPRSRTSLSLSSRLVGFGITI